VPLRHPVPAAKDRSMPRSSACSGALLRLTSPSLWGVGGPNGCDLPLSACISGAYDITLTLIIGGQPMSEDRPLHQACPPALAPVSQGASVHACMLTRPGSPGVDTRRSRTYDLRILFRDLSCTVCIV